MAQNTKMHNLRKKRLGFIRAYHLRKDRPLLLQPEIFIRIQR